MRALASLVLAGVLTTACGASEEEVVREFTAYVAGANSCSAATDCASVTPDCPLGCFHAVRADRRADVEKKARELVERYQRGGVACAYSCASPGPLACVASRCAFASDAPDAGH